MGVFQTHNTNFNSCARRLFPQENNSYHESVGYTDQMLKEFFERSKKEEWYKNTL